MKKFLLLFIASFLTLSYAQDSKVRLDMFVMALCPDAYACETTYAPVISQVGSIVDLHLNYIAQVDPNGGFDCMHGENECAGDIQQLCAYNMDSSQNYTWWNFVQCQDETQHQIPFNGESCADQVGLEYTQLENCANSDLGVQLMTDSLNFSNKSDVAVSCTIWIDSELFCVHDGTWKQCKTYQVPEIVSYICNQYQGPNPPDACG